MKIRQYQVGREKVNGYLLIENKHAILIDAPSEEILEAVRQEDVSVDCIILTHEHVDHLWGLNQIRAAVGCKVIATKECSIGIQDPKLNKARDYHIYYALRYHAPLPAEYKRDYCCTPAEITFQEQSRMVWQGNQILLQRTPGHSSGSCMIRVNSGLLFSGDTLLHQQETFAGFSGGDPEELKRTQDTFIRSLDESVMIYPGHDEPFLFKDWLT